MPQSDQLVLIKAGFMQVWLVRIARMFNAQHMTLTMVDGSFITRNQLEVIFAVCGEWVCVCVCVCVYCYKI